MGRRCEECGGTLELNRFFPSVVRPRGDWRSFIGEEEDEELGPRVYSQELIAFATEHTLPEINSALSETCRAVFIRDVLGFEVSRRLGNLDYLVSLGYPRESRLPPEWKRSLRIAADFYVSRAPPRLGQYLELAEVLRGLRFFQPVARVPMGPLSAALHSESELLHEVLLELLSALSPLPWEKLWREVLPLLRCGRREQGAFGLTVLRAALGGEQHSLGFSLRDQVFDRVLQGLTQASEEQLGTVWKTLVPATAGEHRDLTALLVGGLGLAPEFIPLLLQPQKQRHLRNNALGFLGALGEAAAETVPRLLEMFGELSQDGRPHLLRALGQVGAGDPRALAFLREHLGEGEFADRQVAFTTLLELHRAGRVEWSEPLAQKGLAVVREALAQGQLAWLINTLDDFPPDWRRRVLPGLEELEGTLLERFTQHEELLSALHSLGSGTLRRLLLASPPLHARLLEHARTHPNDSASREFLAAVGPETPGALLLIQRQLRERDCHAWDRLGAVQLLGPFVGGHPSPAEALLLDLFMDDREDVATRLEAAKGLAPAAGRLQGRERLVSALRDEAALIRGWAYLLLGEGREVHARDLARDPSPAVRQLVLPQDEVRPGG